jgi:hypothetical protein
MVIPSRRLLFSLAVSGWLGTAASAQDQPLTLVGEPVAAPATEFVSPPVIYSEAAQSTTTLTPVPDDGIVRITDCPNGRAGAVHGNNTGRKKCEPPTTGWVPPGRYIMHRHWVPYYKFFPNSWTGQPTPVPQVRLPMVYMPTDTTQLGYYYQHVPHWHAYSGMVPPVPRPMDWHAKYQAYPTATPTTYRVVPKEDLGEPGTMPEPGVQPAPPPPVQDLDKSAASPELLPLPR